ncbi:glutathione S-transferase family protein [Aestuariivirga sp. YIM B02566]|uniref:Glutathione S-transferase family protein n=1 Tax=Taklimakanibacter albus TaxID=2800327 RepID=A0ACC5R193_9HYPH|nr:glutathione S-transferase family protein [Aestuariivirga sp. YIM B02566]MBK1866370.1 glutathione S-transferase family protein [Aestuariivirga sp. YIM B02566]
MAKAAKKVVKKAAVRKPVSKTSARRPVKPSPRPKPEALVAGNKERFTLHGFAMSGPTYTVALMLSLCRHPFSYIHVNLREGAHKQPDYLVKNRYGQVPCLRDGQIFLSQSAAILEYLAGKLGKFDGKTDFEQQRVREWMFWIWDKLAAPIYRLRQRARGLRQFGDEVKVMYDGEARSALNVLEHELSKSEWLAGRKPTIADIDAYGVIRFAAEAGMDVQAYPKVADWKKRFEALPGFATPEQLLPLESRLL